MRPDERFRAPWGTALYVVFLAIFLPMVAAIARLELRMWALDDVPLGVDVLIPLGTALFATGFICAVIPCIRWQGGGVLARPRDGALSLGLPRSIYPFLILACVGAWVFIVGGVFAAVHLALNTSISLPGIGTFVLLLGLAALLTHGLFRMTRIRFVADGWGLRWDHPVWPSSTHLPWEQILSIDLRGSRVFAMRIVVITIDGRSRLIWLFDTSIPVSKASFRALVAEIAGLRPSVPASPS